MKAKKVKALASFGGKEDWEQKSVQDMCDVSFLLKLISRKNGKNIEVAILYCVSNCFYVNISEVHSEVDFTWKNVITALDTQANIKSINHRLKSMSLNQIAWILV